MSRPSARVSGRILLAAALTLGSGSRTLAADCDEPTARLVARAYVVSFPMAFKEDEFASLLATNAKALGKNGKATRCMKTVGTRLMGGALAAGSSEHRDYATERWGGSMPEGLEHLPGQVDASMNSWSNDSFAMAQELLWLSEVLPAAAAGNRDPFDAQDTLARRMWLEQALPMIQLLCNMDQTSCQIMVNAMLAALPLAEAQVYALVLQLGQ